MIHTLTISYRILSYKMFDGIYKELERITGEKLRKIEEGCYMTNALKEKGFTNIQLISKKVHSKYKYNFMQIRTTLNPLKLLKRNKLDVLEVEQLEELRKIFNKEIENININLPSLDYWVVNRIDYAINVHTPYAKEYIKLFQRADKPRGFKELYSSKARARKQLDGSFYLFNNSVTINIYDKEAERLYKNFNTDGAKDLLRIEIQCKTSKTYTLKSKYRFDSKHLHHYLSQELSYKQLEYYFNKTIGAGDYYTLSEAIKMIKESNYTSSTKNKLIDVITAINKHKGIWKAREQSQYNASCFNRYLKQIRALGVNPVTIPVRWDIKYLENILSVSNGTPFATMKKVS